MPKRLGTESAIKRFLESHISERARTSQRGLWWGVDAIELRGRPMQSIKVWSTLHFLGKDTPYCCMEPGCHLGLFCGAPTIRDVMCRKLKINPSVELEFVDMAAYVHASAKFEDVF